MYRDFVFFFFFQAEDGIRDIGVTGVQTCALPISYSEAPKKVLIIGGGFGGLAVLEGLVKTLDGDEEVGVALLDRVNFTTFYPMVPSVISGNVEVRHVAHSIRRIIQPLGAEFYQREVTGVDFGAREVKTTRGAFSYDYLVLAPGSRTAFFGTPGALENS